MDSNQSNASLHVSLMSHIEHLEKSIRELGEREKTTYDFMLERISYLGKRVSALECALELARNGDNADYDRRLDALEGVFRAEPSHS